jgi:2-C-methyl-D-erythritol 2,4-cyclodiphosphate synthase
MTALRIGMGFDSHPWSDDSARVLVLGGVSFPDEKALTGHSDADVIAHACTDALLSAAGLGDIGMMFPDTDESLAGANSIELLRLAANRVREAGFEPVNVDCSVVVEQPKVAPWRDEMINNLTNAAGAPVTLKGKRPEGLGPVGDDGALCWAVALVEKQ